jgi:hypothetical protein
MLRELGGIVFRVPEPKSVHDIRLFGEGAGHSPKHLVVDRRDGVSKALHCESNGWFTHYGRTIFSIALILDPYQNSTHQACCQARDAIALPPELSGRGKKVACPFAGTPAAVRHCG